MNKENPKWRLYVLLILLALTCLSALILGVIKLRVEKNRVQIDNGIQNIQSVGEEQAEVIDQEAENEQNSDNKTTTPTPEPTARPTRLPLNKEVSIGDISRKQIALTLDAGSSAAQTPEILDILKGNNIEVTFFVTGKWAEENPALIRRMVAEGHTLGNHTYDHKDLTTLSDQEIKTEFERTEDILKNILPSIVLKPYFRPPYGARNQHVWNYAASLGYQSVYWTVDAWDWRPDATAQIVKQRIYDNAKNGAIILMHVGDDITPAILPEVIRNLQAKGFIIGNLESVLAN